MYIAFALKIEVNEIELQDSKYKLQQFWIFVGVELFTVEK